MEAIVQLDEKQRQQSLRGLTALILGLVIVAAALYAVSGPPRLPSGVPTFHDILSTLRGTYLPLDALAYVLVTAAWAVLLWIAASLALRLVVCGAEAIARGAPWVEPLHAFSDRVTLPIVRRLVDGALVAIVVVYLVGRPPQSASAAPVTPNTAAVQVMPRDRVPQEPAAPLVQQDAQQVTYTVQPGDTLWRIAERLYGTGFEFPRLVQANAGREMPDGARFTQAGVIRPGWTLVAPLPSTALQVLEGNTYYVVEEGDTLRGIAARFLGEEGRWPEIFAANKGTAKLDDKRTLMDPDLIWPGLQLKLPLVTPADPVEPAGPPEALAPATPAPVEPDPVAVSPAPDPEATVPAAERATFPVPSVVVEPEPALPEAEDRSLLVPSALGLAAAAVTGIALLRRRMARRSLSELPVAPESPGAPVGHDFADAELARALTHRIHGGEMDPVTLVAEQALRFLGENGIQNVSVVTARQGRGVITLALNAMLLEQTRISELAAEFGARMGGTGAASLSPDHDVVWQIGGLKSALLPAPPANGSFDPLWLLPLGMLANRGTIYANWAELGNVLIAGLPGSGVDIVMTSVLSTLTARCRPEELRLWTIASRRILPSELAELPHQCSPFVDPSDERAVDEALREVRAELLRRMNKAEPSGTPNRAPDREEPDLVLVIGELAGLRDDGTTLDMIGSQGPAHGIHLLAATQLPEAVGDELLMHFGTRVTSQTLDDDQSIRLIGQPDAADLGRGDLLLRLDGREPILARGFRVSVEHLDQMVRLMHQAYGGRYRPPTSTTTSNEAVGSAVNEDGGEAYLARREDVQPEDPLSSPTEPAEEGLAQAAGPAYRAPHHIRESTPASEGPSAGCGVDVLVTPTPRLERQEKPANGHQGMRPTLAELARATDSVVAAVSRCEDRQNGHQAAPAQTAVADMPAAAAEVPLEVPGDSSLIQIQCLGGFVVRSGDREITPAGEEGGQYKAWEVLAFLATHPDGTVSKDKLISALWPDVDTERGANRMRVTMARLRALLAHQVPGLSAEVVRAERDGTCRLDTTLVTSDACQFLALCQNARRLPAAQAKDAYQKARALYHGDMLNGPGARVYEWVEERDDSGISPRERFREEYYQATQRLARLLCREGQIAQAIPLYKSLLKAEPTLEDVVRDLYRCYQKLGDLGSLIREDRQLKQALREAYYDPDDPEDDPDCYQPEPETVDLFKVIREELEAKGTHAGSLQRAGRA